MKYEPKTKPFPHQSRAVIKAVKQRNYAFFFEPRLGKTKAALDYTAILALKGLAKRVLVLAPRIALDVWEDQLEEHYPYPYTAEDFTTTWSSSTTIFAGSPPHTQFFIAGREATFRAPKNSAGKRIRTKQQELESWNPDVVVIDESHEYARPGGRAAQDAWRMIRRLRQRRRKSGDTSGRPYVLLLSGTPTTKTYRSLFAQFRILDDSILGTNASTFDDDWVVYGTGSRKYTIVKFRRPKKFLRIVGAHSSSVSAEEAGLAGEKFWQSIRVDLPPKARRIYEDLAENFVAELGDGRVVDASNAGVKRLRLLQIAGGYLPDGEQVHSEKLAGLKEYLSSLFSQGERAIVYCRFLSEVAACREVATRVGFNTALIRGSTPRPSRVSAIRAFQKTQATSGIPPKCLIFQVQTGKQSIDLSAGAEVIYYSTPDGWVDYWQSFHRVLGPNQKKPVRITHIVARGTVDVSAMAGLRKKEDAHATMMKNPRRYLLGL